MQEKATETDQKTSHKQTTKSTETGELGLELNPIMLDKEVKKTTLHATREPEASTSAQTKVLPQNEAKRIMVETFVGPISSILFISMMNL